jgi:hypothetical protein
MEILSLSDALPSQQCKVRAYLRDLPNPQNEKKMVTAVHANSTTNISAR